MTQTRMKGDSVSFEHPCGLKFEVPTSAVKLDPGKLQSSPLAHRLLDVADTCAAVARHITVDWAETVTGEHGSEALGQMDKALLVSAHLDRTQTGFVVVTSVEDGETWVMLDEEFPPLETRRKQKQAH